jgi:lipopolysaccharide export system protein LptC
MTIEATLSHGQHGWRDPGQSELAARLRRVRRHSRFVRLLRFGIPAVFISFVGVYWLVGWFNPFSALPGLDMSGIVISRSQVAIERPRMSGYTRDGRPYELTATSAMQDLRSPQFIGLKGIRGKVAMRDGEVVSISAEEGRYDTKAELVVLEQDVVVVTTEGTEIRMGSARVDARNGRLLSERDVEVRSQAGTLSAREMEVREGGAVLTFRGGVTMDLQKIDRLQKEESQ